MTGRISRWFSAGPDEVREREGGRLEISPALRAFIEAVNSVGSEEDPTYRSAVAALLADVEASVGETVRIEIEAPVNDIGLRRSLVMALAAIPHADAATALQRVALRPLGTSPAPGETSMAEAQLGLRMQAVDGLAVLAARGIGEAREGLLKAALCESLAVQAVALASIRELPDGEAAIEQVMAQIPEDRRYLAALRHVAVHEVPQIREARSTLLRERGSGVRAPVLGEDGRPSDPDHRRPTDTPRVSPEGRQDG